MELCFIAGDVEGSVGQAYPPVSSMVSTGACVIGEGGETFYAELKPLNDLWDEGAEKIHRLSREHLRLHGGDPGAVTFEFSRWVVHVADGREAVYCAKPVRYDWSYVRWYLTHFTIANPFRWTLDTRDLYRKMKGLSEHKKISVKRLLREFPTTRPHDHNALHDSLELGDIMEPMIRIATPEQLRAALCDATAYLIR